MIHNDPVDRGGCSFSSVFVAGACDQFWSVEPRLGTHHEGDSNGFGVSIAAALLAGALVASLEGGPIGFTSFKTPLASFALSAAIGVTAGLSCADDAGRRYLIGVAAAVQFAVFPVWFGLSFVLGLPPLDIALNRLLCFGVNVVTISASAALAYALLHLRSGGWSAPRRARL